VGDRPRRRDGALLPGALARGFTPSTIFDYWAHEPWTGSTVVDDVREAETLLLVNELLNVL
jgi:hypothetical protein